MNTLVLDASVAVAWYLPETFQAAAREWQQKVLEGSVSLVVPDLHFWEVGNVLRTYVRRGELGPGLAAEIYGAHLEAPLDVLEPERSGVLETALEMDCTVYDAVYVALARFLEVKLLTAERKTRPWVVRLGDQVQTLHKA